MSASSEPTPARAAPPATGVLRATPIVATIGVVVALIGFLALLRPIETPVQDCGTVAGFLLDGRVNEFADPSIPPDGLTEDQVLDNNERPCRVRVGEAARPSVVLIAAGLVAALVAVVVEATIRGLRWRRRHRGAGADPTTDPDPEAGG